MNPPCRRDCPDRRAECHNKCEAYAEYAAWCAAQREKRRIEREGRVVSKWKDYYVKKRAIERRKHR